MVLKEQCVVKFNNPNKNGRIYSSDCFNLDDPIIQERLKKLRERIVKILQPSKLTQAQQNALFQAKVLSQLKELYEAQETFTKVLKIYADTLIGEIKKLQN